MSAVNLVLFGDQTVEKRSSIQSLVRHSKTSAGARRLLQEATDLVQLNFARLSKEDSSWNHEIHTLLGLAENNIDEENPNGVIATVLMCIGRLGELIVYAEEDPSILGSEQNPVQVLAFCTGLLPAAALVVARDTSELFDIAKEIISITFRMAHEIIRRMKLIEDTNLSWAVTMIGKTPEKVQPILDGFHKAQEIPYAKRVAIGVVSNGWLTLMGAPSSLVRLMAFSKELDEAPKAKTDTNGAVHTVYMPSFDVKTVLGDSPLLDARISSKARIISPASCKPYHHATLRSLLGEIMLDIAHNILRINDTAEECISGFLEKGSVSLTVVGPTGHLTAVQRVLKSKGLDHEIRQHRNVNHSTTRRGGSDLVAIVGMAGRFPGSETIDGFFEDLIEGKMQLKKIPKSRFDLERYFDPTGKRRNTTSAQHGAFLDRPGHFDNRLFNVSPREAMQMDPLQRLLLTTSYEALETAGYSKDATPATQSDRIATYFGQAAEDWPSRLSYHHKWGGGTYALDAACATSTTAIQLACSALNARECDTALAGGGSLLVSPNTFAGLSRSGMISSNGGCRTYHDDADGYARGEGIGVVVLKRLEDALADNDNILGVIRGSARTYTSTSTSITHPSAESQARIYEEVLRQTSVVPNEIAYVEMHGTGTQAGDFEEMTSVIRVLGRGRSRDNPLTVGAVKANVGHGEGAAGITSLIKVLMMMRERRIPTQPSLPFKLNRNFPKLEGLNIRIAGVSGKDLILKPSPAAVDRKIKCLVNSFDASGGNTSLVVEEPPIRAKKEENPLTCHTITISARTIASLQANRRRLLELLTRNPHIKIADLAYTTTARRMHENLRIAYTARSTRDIIIALRDDVSKNAPSDPRTKPPAMNIVFAFTGQGSQYAGMGKQLYEHNAAFRDVLHTYQQIAEHQGLPKFLHLISERKSDIAATSAVCVQLAVVALEIATAHTLRTWGIKPNMVIGHSLGEYSALCIAGVLSVSDTIYLVGRRAQLMEDKLTAGEYAMLAIGKDLENVRQLLEKDSKTSLSKVAVACINAPQVVVTSGPVDEVNHLKTKLEEEGSRATVLRVPYGFHSHHIDPILDDYEAVAQSVTFSAPTIPVASTLLGKIVDKGQRGVFSPAYLTRQARECVNFTGALQAIQDHAVSKLQVSWLEIGPDPICIGLVRRSLDLPANRLLPIMRATEDNWTTVCSTLAQLYRLGSSINWTEYYKEYLSSVRLISLPTYAFDEKEFWTPFVERHDPSLLVHSDSSRSLLESPKTPSPHKFSTASLQWIEDEEAKEEAISVTFASQTSEPSLYGAIQGHIVNGLTICSLSIFCDMAKSAAQYAYQKLNRSSKVPAMSIHDVNMTHALVVIKLDPELIVKTKVSYSSNGDAAHVVFFSTSAGNPTEHGTCKVTFEDNTAWFSQLSQTSFLVGTRVQALKDMSANGKAHRLLKPVVYRLFDNLVTYSKTYQGLEEVWVDAECRDAVGTVKLPINTGSGNFLFNPFWIDSAIHLAGFLVNGSLKYPENIACLSTGFESWRLLEELQADDIYTTYVSMQETATNLLSGSAYVYNGEQKLVQVTTGIRFQKMKKLALKSILQPAVAHSDKMTTREKFLAPKQTPGVLSTTGSSTPRPHPSDSSDDDKGGESGGTVTPASSISGEQGVGLLDTLLTVVASEIGCSVDDMQPDTAFADLGMDSLMAITIIATFHRDSGVELPATFFLDHTTVKEAKEALPDRLNKDANSGLIVESSPGPATILPSSPDRSETPNSATLEIGDRSPVEQEPTPEPMTFPSATRTEIIKPSKIVLLHGSPVSTGPKLFLFPDGSGSPSRYIQLPALGEDINVYGIESPFLKAPAEYTCSVEAMCNSFITAMKTIQPSSPYLLGGFSLGAMYAYEVARILLGGGEQVETLFILDMAVPKSLTQAISPTHEQIVAAELLPPTGRLTIAQKEHVARTIHAITAYTLTALPADERPRKSILISSQTGLSDGKDSELARWAKGSDLAVRGWENLVGPVTVHTVEAEHLAMFKHPAIKALRDVLAEELLELK